MAKKSTTSKTAKKKTRTSKKVSKHYPVQRNIRVEETTSSAAFHVIRSDKLLSNVNHRLYRQSRVYSLKVKIDPDWDTLAAQSVNVYVLADTWMNQKAYQMAYKQFIENSKEESEQLGSSKARWNDFRVDHGLPIGPLNGSETKAYQFEPDGSFVNDDKVFLDEGEYLMSEVSDAAGTKRTFRWTGTGTNTFNIISEYDLTGNMNASPSTPVGAAVAYDGLSDEVDDNQMQHLSSDGNLPPYNSLILPNACWVLAATLRAGGPETTRMSTGILNAPCGLVLIGGTEAVMDGVILEYKAGDYKGVHAPSYLE